MEKVEMIGVKDVMDLLRVGRPTAVRYLNAYYKTAGRKHSKGQKFIVPKENFTMFINQGGAL